MPKNNNPRMLLARVRGGDFAHAGDKEAVEIVLNKLLSLIKNKDCKKKILDVGCGTGGTAAYIQNNMPADVYGIDIDDAALKYGEGKYPEVKFFKSDIMDLEHVFEKAQFDIIYLFNVFYAIPQQQESLKALASVAKPGAILAIFDYVSDHSCELKDFAGKPMNPVSLDNLKIGLEENGWELIEIVDLSDKYNQWYSEFLKKLVDNKDTLLNEFTAEAFNAVYHLFSILLESINNKQMGGAVVYARCKNYPLMFDKNDRAVSPDLNDVHDNQNNLSF